MSDKLLARIAELEIEKQRLREELEQFNPDMLSIALDMRMLDYAALAEQTEMSVGRVSKIANGIVAPTKNGIGG